MVYSESQESKNLMHLNEEYLDVYYSKPYQKRINRKIRKLDLQTVVRELTSGYFVKRFKGMITGGRITPETDFLGKVREINTDDRIAIYTVIVGDYDSLKQPLFISNQCDYYVISDHVIDTSGTCWKLILIDNFNINPKYSNTKKARYVKTHPEVFFPNYRYSIFLDGNFQIIADLVPLVEQLGDGVFATHLHPGGTDCVYTEAKNIVIFGKSSKTDVNKQISFYKGEGFPEHFGLCETNVLVREHNDSHCKAVDSAWWNEIDKFTIRDQLSLTYVVWKLEKSFKWIVILGNNPRRNPRLRYYSHK